MPTIARFFSILPLTALAALAAMPARAEPAERLLRLAGEAASGAHAEVHLEALDRTRRLELEFPGGRAAVVVERSRVDRRGDGEMLWSGRTEKGEQLVLTVSGGRLAGTFFGRDGAYRIEPRGEGGHVVRDDASKPPIVCGGAPLAAGGEEGARLDERLAAAPPSHRTPRIDVLVLYASESRSAVGSKRNMLTVVQHFLDLTNVAFHNSEMEGRVRLAHAAEVEVPSGGGGALLQWLVDSRAIRDLRAAHGADVVGLIYEGEGDSVCGSAAMIYRPGGPTLSRAFFVSQRVCGADTFAHEVGHLLGADHNPEDANTGRDPFVDGRGHYHDGSYRTIMSYTTGCSLDCPSQPFFSSPAVRFDRRETGVAEERDNARVIDALAGEVERFSAAIDGAACELAPGDPDYCLECGPCRAGEGSCQADSECEAGLGCDAGGGPDFGFDAVVGVCRARGGCDLASGDPDYCRICGPCGFGDGDCDSDRECQVGLDCVDDVGASFGLPASTDVCAFGQRGFCGTNYPFLPALGDPDYCEVCGPCAAGEGGCKSTTECVPFHECFPEVGVDLGFPSGTAVCLQQLPTRCLSPLGTADHCKVCGVCDVGEGDCDTDRECRDGLTCVDGGGAAFGFDESIDVCQPALRAPRRLKGKVLSSGRVRLQWKDKSSNEDGFHVEMRVGDGRFERIASTGKNARKLVLRDLEPGATYSFRVQAFNRDTVSAYSNERTVKLP